MGSNDVMYREKLYCPVCATVMLANEERRTLPTGEKGHKKCADKVIRRVS